MDDTLMTIIGIFIAGILIVIPIMSVADRADDVSQQAVQTIVTDYVENIKATGKMSLEDYTKLQTSLAATGNAYIVDQVLKVSDETIGKKATQVETIKIGESTYYVLYSSQLMDLLNPKDENGKPLYENGRTLLLKEGDIISVSVKNTNKTIAQSLRDAMYKLSGDDTYQVGTSHGGVITRNGK